MWLLARIVVLGVAFVARAVFRASPPKVVRALGGRPAHEKLTVAGKPARVTKFRIGVTLPARVVLRIERERASDRILKALGLCSEVQTGDEGFDRLAYVACDHPGVHDLLARDARARDAIGAVFRAGFTRITHDGAVLWIARPAHSGPDPSDWRILSTLATSFEHLASHVEDRSSRYDVRAALCEATVFSIAAFAVASVVPVIVSIAESLAFGTLLLYALLAATAAFLVLQGVIVVLLRGSSRARFVVLESAVVLAIALPIVAVQTVVDVNERWGTVERVSGIRTIEGLERLPLKLSAVTFHHALLSGGDSIDGDMIPRRLRIGRSTFDAATPGDLMHVTVAKGGLGLSWIVEYRLEKPGAR